jgi:hypothetical protein
LGKQKKRTNHLPKAIIYKTKFNPIQSTKKESKLHCQWQSTVTSLRNQYRREREDFRRGSQRRGQDTCHSLY